MQEKYLFEYAVLRIMPRVEREEFLNIGVIVYVQKLKFLQMKFHLDKDRVKALSDLVDIEALEANICSFEKIAHAAADGGPIALLDVPSRFRWLTATRSTVLQSSKVHTGFCTDPEVTVQKLFAELVL